VLGIFILVIVATVLIPKSAKSERQTRETSTGR
jgi:hypothetical protein